MILPSCSRIHGCQLRYSQSYATIQGRTYKKPVNQRNGTSLEESDAHAPSEPGPAIANIESNRNQGPWANIFWPFPLFLHFGYCYGTQSVRGTYLQ